MVFDYKPVALNLIRDDDTTYQISTGKLEDQLTISIEKIGLISPPVIQFEGDHYIIVCGFKRVAACRSLGWETITAACLPSSSGSECCALTAIADNTSQRRLNLVELSRAYHLLKGASEGIDQVIAHLKALGISTNHDLIAKFEKINQMQPVIQQSIIDQTVALPVAIQIHEMTDQSLIEEIIQLLNELKLSLNRQRELMDWLEAISTRERIPMIDLLKEKEIKGLREDTTLDTAHKTNMIRQYFKQRRFPNITEFEQRYEQCRKALKLPKGVQLTPPPHFEGQHFNFTISFTNQAELLQLNTEIQRLADSEILCALLNSTLS